MNRKELIGRITGLLKECDKRKFVAPQKTIFYISDNNGNRSNFVVKNDEKGLLYTEKDVTEIMDACLAVIVDSIKHGEEISIKGFGALKVNYRQPRQTRHPDTGELVNVKGRYIPKFNYGNTLRMAARIYEFSLSDRKSDIQEEDQGGDES